MSGAEIVLPIAFGGWPILVNAVSGYKHTLRHVKKALNRRKYVDKITLTLLEHWQAIEEVIKYVLRESGVRDVPCLIEKHLPHDLLEQKDVAKKVAEFLGPLNWEVFVGVLKDCSETIQNATKLMARLVPELGDSAGRNKLLHILKTNRTKDNQKWHARQKLKLLFTNHHFKRYISDLDIETSRLDKLTHQVVRNRKAMTTDTPSEKAAMLAKAFCQIRGFAANLHLALDQGWKERCHTKHNAQLFLEDRFDVFHKILEDHDEQKTPPSPMLSFPLILAPSYSQKHDPVWHETNVDVYSYHHRKESQDPLSPTSQTPLSSKTSKSLKPTTPKRGLSSSSKSPSQVLKPQLSKLKFPLTTLVTNICDGIKLAKKNHHLSLLLMKEPQVGMMAVAKPMWKTYNKPATESLNGIFNMQPQYGAVLPLKPRLKLALKLAANIIQLPQDQWLKNPWSKDNIRFVSRKTISIRHQDNLYDFDRPFVSLSFENDALVPHSQTDSIPVEEAILELSILLMEIWHGVSMETRFSSTINGYYDRFRYATEWYDAMENPMMNFYDKAVKACIFRTFWNRSKLDGSWSWENVEFCEAFCEEIVLPLAKACEQFH